jgi:hypothetical protein
MGFTVWRPARHVKRECPTSPVWQGKSEDVDNNELVSRFEVYTDDKEITFDKLT